MPPAAAKLREVLAGPHAATLGPLPKILLPGDDHYMSEFIHEAASIITTSHDKPELAPHLYRRDCLPIIPLPGTRRFGEMKPEYFQTWAERHFAPYKIRYDKYGDPYDVLRSMTKEVARACLESLEFTHTMPPIKRTYPVPVPIITDGGPLHLCTPGYHQATGAYVFPSDFPPDPALIASDGMVSSGGYYDDHMTLREAVCFLHSLHAQMPFSDWSEPFTPSEDNPFHDPEDPRKTIRLSRSLAVQIMSMLALFAGGCVPPQASRLGILYNANKQRSGKTLLGKIAVSSVYGHCKLQSWRESEEDMIKLLDSETIAATTYIFFDNIRSLIASAPLEGFMTTAVWTGRVLGQSQMFEAENNAIILLSGNNSSLGADMQERTLICDLYVETADRQERETTISRDSRIDDVWLANVTNRRRILSALWSIVRHWDAAGRPLASGRPRRGFDVWCEILGGMVEFAGFGDALERPTNLENCGDSETDDIRTLVEYASRDCRARACTFQEIVHICWEKGLLPWCLHGKEDWDTDLNRTTLKLNDSSNSRMGVLLQRNCSGERGEVHVFRQPDGSTRHIRFYCRGKGRSRRYHFDDVSTHAHA